MASEALERTVTCRLKVGRPLILLLGKALITKKNALIFRRWHSGAP
jgi:hypothetical protein